MPLILRRFIYYLSGLLFKYVKFLLCVPFATILSSFVLFFAQSLSSVKSKRVIKKAVSVKKVKNLSSPRSDLNQGEVVIKGGLLSNRMFVNFYYWLCGVSYLVENFQKQRGKKKGGRG